MRFWDTSAFIPLLVRQSESATAIAWMQEDDAVVLWTLALVEAVSAIRRLLREGALDESAARSAEQRLTELLPAVHAVVDIERVKATALRLLRVHPVRAADALQLGAALEWSEGQPAGRVLLTFDGRLASAAQREGFTVLPVP